jgi:hypothetical protein
LFFLGMHLNALPLNENGKNSYKITSSNRVGAQPA